MHQLDVLQTAHFQAAPPQTKYRTAVRFTIMWGRVWGRLFSDPNKGIDIKSLFRWFDSSPATILRIAPGMRAETVPDGRIAQLVEQLTLNQRVLGSSPSASTIVIAFYPQRQLETVFLVAIVAADMGQDNPRKRLLTSL